MQKALSIDILVVSYPRGTPGTCEGRKTFLTRDPPVPGKVENFDTPIKLNECYKTVYNVHIIA